MKGVLSSPMLYQFTGEELRNDLGKLSGLKKEGVYMKSPDIVFPNLGIELNEVNPIAFELFGIEVYWYGICIISGVFAGLLLAQYRAKKDNQDPGIYSDFLMYGLLAAIIGARMYYVAFTWSDYKDNFWDVFAFREGGLAIYGGVIGAIIALAIYTRTKKLSFAKLGDVAAPGLALGQVFGRMGNFINMEAFGGPTNSLFAMGLKATKAKIPSDMLSYIAPINGYEGNYLLVQPTFAYEALWNIGLVIFIMFYTKHKKFEGEIVAIYLFGYGLGRSWIEGLRTDQLLIGTTNLAVSQVLSILLVVGSLVYIVYRRRRVKKI
jgi:phosphatidylglycerol---prolipoprotein diacylglyceryl transferase